MKMLMAVVLFVASFNYAMWWFFAFPVTTGKELKKELLMKAHSPRSAFRPMFFASSSEAVADWEKYQKSQREEEIRRWVGFGWWDQDTQKWLAEIAAAEAVGFKKNDPFVKNRVEWMVRRNGGGTLEIGLAKCGLDSIRREAEPADQIRQKELKRREDLLKESRVQAIKGLQKWMEKDPTYFEWDEQCEKKTENKEIQLFEKEAPIWKSGSVMDLVEEGLITRGEMVVFLQAIFNRGPIKYVQEMKNDPFTRQYYHAWERTERNTNLRLVFPQTEDTGEVAARMKEILVAHKVTEVEMKKIGLEPDHLQAVFGFRWKQVITSPQWWKKY